MYKRQESFRLELPEPLPVVFTLYGVNNQILPIPKKGRAEILNISPSGLKVRMPLNIDCDKVANLTFEFTIMNQTITSEGKLVWQRKEFDKFCYGVQLMLHKDQQELLINELKLFTKQKLKEERSKLEEETLKEYTDFQLKLQNKSEYQQYLEKKLKNKRVYRY